MNAVVVEPWGAHPSYAHGYYRRDNAFYRAWDAISRDRAAFQAWLDAHVLASQPGAFQTRAHAVSQP